MAFLTHFVPINHLSFSGGSRGGSLRELLDGALSYRQGWGAIAPERGVLQGARAQILI